MIISILKGWMTWITVRKVLHYRALLEEFLSLLVPLFGLPLFFLPFLFCFGFLSVQAVSIGVVMREWWTGGPVRGVKIFSPSRRCRCSDSQEQRELRFCHPRDPSHGNWGGGGHAGKPFGQLPFSDSTGIWKTHVEVEYLKVCLSFKKGNCWLFLF